MGVAIWEDVMRDEFVVTLILTYLDTHSFYNMSLVNHFYLRLFHSLTQHSIHRIRVDYLNEQRGIELIDSTLIDFFSCLGSSHAKRIDGIVESLAQFQMNLRRLARFKSFTDSLNYTENETMASRFLQYLEERSGDSPMVLSGGLILSALQSAQNDQLFQLTKLSDMDVFFIQNRIPGYEGMYQTEYLQYFDNLFKEVTGHLYANWHEPYLVIHPMTTVELVEKSDIRLLQFVLRPISSVEELLCFFDIGCVQFAYDGKRLLTTRLGLQSLTQRKNTVQKVPLRVRRVKKFHDRGYPSVLSRYHPMQEHNYDTQNWIDYFLKSPTRSSDYPLDYSYYTGSEEYREAKTFCKISSKQVITDSGCSILIAIEENTSYGMETHGAFVARSIEGFLKTIGDNNLFRMAKMKRRTLLSSIKALSCFECEVCRQIYHDALLEESYDIKLRICHNCSGCLSEMSQHVVSYFAGKNILVFARSNNAEEIRTCVPQYANFARVAIVSTAPIEDLNLDNKRTIVYSVVLPLQSASDVVEAIAKVRQTMGQIDIVINMRAAEQLVVQTLEDKVDEFRCKGGSTGNKRVAMNQNQSDAKRRKLNNKYSSNNNRVVQANVVLDVLTGGGDEDQPELIVNWFDSWHSNHIVDKLFDLEQESETSHRTRVVTYSPTWTSMYASPTHRFMLMMFDFAQSKLPQLLNFGVYSNILALFIRR